MTTSVESLFQMFMQDPDIQATEQKSREEVALGEAEQRFRQSVNNHRALSLAKGGSIEELFDYLRLNKSDDTIMYHRRGTEGNRTPTDIQEPHTGEMSNKELIEHLKDEVMGLHTIGGRSDEYGGGDFPHSYEDILENPELSREAIINDTHHLLWRPEAPSADFPDDDDEDESPPTDTPDMTPTGEEGGEGEEPRRIWLPGEEISGLHVEDMQEPKTRQGQQSGWNALGLLRHRANSPEAREALDELQYDIHDFNNQQLRLDAGIHVGRTQDENRFKPMDEFEVGEEGSRDWHENERLKRINSVMQSLKRVQELPEHHLNSPEFTTDVLRNHELTPKQQHLLSPSGSSDPRTLRDAVRRGYNVNVHHGNHDAVDRLIERSAAANNIALGDAHQPIPGSVHEAEADYRTDNPTGVTRDIDATERETPIHRMTLDQLSQHFQDHKELHYQDFLDELDRRVGSGEAHKDDIQSLKQSLAPPALSSEEIENLQQGSQKYGSGEEEILANANRLHELGNFVRNDITGKNEFDPVEAQKRREAVRAAGGEVEGKKDSLEDYLGQHESGQTRDFPYSHSRGQFSYGKSVNPVPDVVHHPEYGFGEIQGAIDKDGKPILDSQNQQVTRAIEGNEGTPFNAATDDPETSDIPIGTHLNAGPYRVKFENGDIRNINHADLKLVNPVDNTKHGILNVNYLPFSDHIDASNRFISDAQKKAISERGTHIGDDIRGGGGRPLTPQQRNDLTSAPKTSVPLESEIDPIFAGESNLALREEDLRDSYMGTAEGQHNGGLSANVKSQGFRNVMRYLIALGVPIQDLTRYNPENGNYIWSPRSMERGMQKWGFLTKKDSITGDIDREGVTNGTPRILHGRDEKIEKGGLKSGGPVMYRTKTGVMPYADAIRERGEIKHETGSASFERRQRLHDQLIEHGTPEQHKSLAQFGFHQVGQPGRDLHTEEGRNAFAEALKDPVKRKQLLDAGRQDILDRLDGGPQKGVWLGAMGYKQRPPETWVKTDRGKEKTGKAISKSELEEEMEGYQDLHLSGSHDASNRNARLNAIRRARMARSATDSPEEQLQSNRKLGIANIDEINSRAVPEGLKATLRGTLPEFRQSILDPPQYKGDPNRGPLSQVEPQYLKDLLRQAAKEKSITIDGKEFPEIGIDSDNAIEEALQKYQHRMKDSEGNVKAGFEQYILPQYPSPDERPITRGERRTLQEGGTDYGLLTDAQKDEALRIGHERAEVVNNYHNPANNTYSSQVFQDLIQEGFQNDHAGRRGVSWQDIGNWFRDMGLVAEPHVPSAHKDDYPEGFPSDAHEGARTLSESTPEPQSVTPAATSRYPFSMWYTGEGDPLSEERGEVGGGPGDDWKEIASHVITPGNRVSHEDYGEGTVQGVSLGDDDSHEIHVGFDDGRTRIVHPTELRKPTFAEPPTPPAEEAGPSGFTHKGIPLSTEAENALRTYKSRIESLNQNPLMVDANTSAMQKFIEEATIARQHLSSMGIDDIGEILDVNGKSIKNTNQNLIGGNKAGSKYKSLRESNPNFSDHGHLQDRFRADTPATPEAAPWDTIETEPSWMGREREKLEDKYGPMARLEYNKETNKAIVSGHDLQGSPLEGELNEDGDGRMSADNRQWRNRNWQGPKNAYAAQQHVEDHLKTVNDLHEKLQDPAYNPSEDELSTYNDAINFLFSHKDIIRGPGDISTKTREALALDDYYGAEGRLPGDDDVEDPATRPDVVDRIPEMDDEIPPPQGGAATAGDDIPPMEEEDNTLAEEPLDIDARTRQERVGVPEHFATTRDPVPSILHPSTPSEVLLGDLDVRKADIERRMEKAKELWNTSPTDDVWYPQRQVPPKEGETKPTLEDVNRVPHTDDQFIPMPAHIQRDVSLVTAHRLWEGDPRTNILRDPNQPHHPENNPSGWWMSREEANATARANMRRETMKAVLDDLGSAIWGYEKTHENLGRSLGMSEEEYQAFRDQGGSDLLQVNLQNHSDKFSPPYAPGTREIRQQFKEDILDPPLPTELPGRGGTRVNNNPTRRYGHINASVEKRDAIGKPVRNPDGSLQYRDRREGDLPINETANYNRPHLDVATGELTSDHDEDHGGIPNIPNEPVNLRTNEPDASNYQHVRPDPADAPPSNERTPIPSNARSWTMDDKEEHAQKIVDNLKSRMKNETAKNYLQGLADSLAMTHGQNEGGYGQIGADGKNWNSSSVLGKLSSLEHQIISGNHENVTMGELAHWGNHNSILFRGVGTTTDDGELRQNMFHENGYGASTRGHAIRHSPELHADADDTDLDDLKRLHGFNYDTQPYLEGKIPGAKPEGGPQTAEQAQKTVERSRAHMKNQQFGRVNENGNFGEKSVQREMTPLEYAKNTILTHHSGTTRDDALKFIEEQENLGRDDRILSYASNLSQGQFDSVGKLDRKSMMAKEAPQFNPATDDPTSFARQIIGHGIALRTHHAAEPNPEVQASWRNALATAEYYGADINRLHKEVAQFPKQHFGSERHMEAVASQDRQNALENSQFHSHITNPDNVEKAFGDPTWHPHASHSFDPDTGNITNTHYSTLDKNGLTRHPDNDEVLPPGNAPLSGNRHNPNTRDPLSPSDAPAVFGLNKQQKSEYGQLHNDLAAHNATPITEDNIEEYSSTLKQLKQRKENFKNSLPDSHKDIVDHPHFGATNFDVQERGTAAGHAWDEHKAGAVNLQAHHDNLISQQNKELPGTPVYEDLTSKIDASQKAMDNHQAAKDPISFIYGLDRLKGSENQNGDLHHVEGIGLVSKSTVHQIQKRLKPGEAFVHNGDHLHPDGTPNGGRPLAFHDDGVTPKTGTHVWIDHNGIQAVRHPDEFRKEHHAGTERPLTDHDVRANNLAHHLHVAKNLQDNPHIENTLDGMHIKSVEGVLGENHPMVTHNSTVRRNEAHGVSSPGSALGEKAGKVAGGIMGAFGAANKHIGQVIHNYDLQEQNNIPLGQRQPFRGDQKGANVTATGKLMNWVGRQGMLGKTTQEQAMKDHFDSVISPPTSTSPPTPKPFGE